MGYYINADEIESKIRSKGFLDLAEYGVTDDDAKRIQKQIPKHSIYTKAITDGFDFDLELKGTVVHNPDQKTHSYEAALIADLLRNFLLGNGKKFFFETVMSHPSKVDFLKATSKQGYKNYLYYISTESPTINIERVYQRVKLGGHPVDETKVEERYFRSLGLLSSAIANTYRSFIFDNSGKNPILILEVFKGREVTFQHNLVPNWVDKYVLNRDKNKKE